MASLLNLMFKEEYRLHINYSSKRMFLSLPAFVYSVSFAMGVTLANVVKTIELKDLIINVDIGIFLYGLSVGAFGFLGSMLVERRQGKINYLIATPSYLPISFKKTFLAFYLKDTVFYLFLMLIPALLGMLLASPIAHLSLISILFVFSSFLLSFLIGISFSFAVSVIYIRSKAAFSIIALSYILLILGNGLLHLYGMEVILPSIGFALNSPPLGSEEGLALEYSLISLGLFLILSAIAARFVKESYEGRTSHFKEILPTYAGKMKFARSFQPYLAKEIVDLMRSGTLSKMIFAFIAPLVFLSFTTWYVNRGLSVPVGFNIVFYAAMVGFFSVLIYSWLTNIDLNGFFTTLPVTVPKVIRTKLIAFLILTSGISTFFVILISMVNNETRLLWLALPVLYATSVYTVVATAYLTGLNPNSFLFNPQILTKFAIVSILPDLGLTILSFSVDRAPIFALAGIFLVLFILMLSTIFFYRAIDKKWGSTEFH